ncbi:MAG: sigma-E factor negative regulatory protein [Burkholderiales bacterium]
MVVKSSEEISALKDGELPQAELARHLANLKNNADLRATWDTYHLIGDALRGHIEPDICKKVSARLDKEVTVLAPRRPIVESHSFGKWAMSLAAGAAALALVVWTVLPGMRGDLQVAQKTAPQQMPSAAVPAATQVADYLLAHQRYSSTSAMQGVAPYVRTVTDERGGGR